MKRSRSSVHTFSQADEEPLSSSTDRNIGLEHIPCSLLLKILDNLDDPEFLDFSTVSKAILRCMKTGKYTAVESELVRNRLEEKRQQMRDRVSQVHERMRRLQDEAWDRGDFSNDSYNFLSDEPMYVQFELLRRDPVLITHFTNPPEELQLAVVERDPFMVLMMKNAPENVKVKAVEKDPMFFFTRNFVEEPSDRVRQAAADAIRERYPIILKELLKITDKHKSGNDKSKALRKLQDFHDEVDLLLKGVTMLSKRDQQDILDYITRRADRWIFWKPKLLERPNLKYYIRTLFPTGRRNSDMLALLDMAEDFSNEEFQDLMAAAEESSG